MAAYTKPGSSPAATSWRSAERGVCARVAQADLRPAGRRGSGGDDQQRRRLPAVRGADPLEPRHRRSLHGHHPVPRHPRSGRQPDAGRSAAADTASTTAKTLDNPGFRGFASFSSGGPRNGDSALKPDIAAPGVSILSTALGTGNKGTCSPAPRWRHRTWRASRRSCARPIRRGRPRRSRRPSSTPATGRVAGYRTRARAAAWSSRPPRRDQSRCPR